MTYSSFQRETFLNNIKVLAKSKGISLKDVESKAGVSQGYFSKVAKEDGPTPSIIVVARVARTLEVLIDTLLTAKLPERSMEDEEMLSLLSDIYSDTTDGTLKWRRYEPTQVKLKDAGPFKSLFDMAYTPDEDDMSSIPWTYIMDNRPASKWQSTNFIGYSYMTKLDDDLIMYLVGAEDCHKNYEQGYDVILQQGNRCKVLFSTRTNEEPEVSALVRAIYNGAELMAFHKYDGVSLDWLRHYSQNRIKSAPKTTTYPEAEE